MHDGSSHIPPIFRIDVSADTADPFADFDTNTMMVALLRQLVSGQERQIQLLEEIAQHVSAHQRQRNQELNQWKDQNPQLARRCGKATEVLARVQAEFLRNLTTEIFDNEEYLTDGEFMLNEFVDRFGPRLAHLNGVLQVLSQLGNIQSTTNDEATSP